MTDENLKKTKISKKLKWFVILQPSEEYCTVCSSSHVKLGRWGAVGGWVGVGVGVGDQADKISKKLKWFVTLQPSEEYCTVCSSSHVKLSCLLSWRLKSLRYTMLAF